MNHKIILSLTFAALSLPGQSAITFPFSKTGTLGSSTVVSSFTENGVSLVAGDIILIAVSSSNSGHGPLTVTPVTGSGSGSYVIQETTNRLYQYNVTGDGTFDLSYSTNSGTFATAGFFAIRASSGEITLLGSQTSSRATNAPGPHSSTVGWAVADDPVYFGLYSSGSTTTIPTVFDLGSQINAGNNRAIGWGDATSVTSVTANWTINDTTQSSRVSLAAYAEVIPEPSAALLGAIGMMSLLRRRR